MVHEATHRFGPGHVDCGFTDVGFHCDEDPDGAYGMDSWWQLRWIEHNTERLALPDCDFGMDTMWSSGCALILDSGDWEPCTDPPDICGWQ